MLKDLKVGDFVLCGGGDKKKVLEIRGDWYELSKTWDEDDSDGPWTLKEMEAKGFYFPEKKEKKKEETESTREITVEVTFPRCRQHCPFCSPFWWM